MSEIAHRAGTSLADFAKGVWATLVVLFGAMLTGQPRVVVSSRRGAGMVEYVLLVLVGIIVFGVIVARMRGSIDDIWDRFTRLWDSSTG